MINIHKSNKAIDKLLKDSNLSTKIQLFFSTKTIGEDYDSREGNYTTTNLNPITVKAYVRDLQAEKVVWRSYGMSEAGYKEILISDRYVNYFRLANKIVIDSDEYQVYKGNGNRFMIEKRPFNTSRIIISKMR